MAARRTTFDKIQRERAKKAKAAAKRERRQARGDDAEVAVGATGTAVQDGGNLTAPQLLERIEDLHRRYAAGGLDLDTFEEQRAELYEQLSLLPMD